MKDWEVASKAGDKVTMKRLLVQLEDEGGTGQWK